MPPLLDPRLFLVFKKCRFYVLNRMRILFDITGVNKLITLVLFITGLCAQKSSIQVSLQVKQKNKNKLLNYIVLRDI